MPATKKPRKKYKPRSRLADPLGYVVESQMLLRDHDGYSIRWSVESRTAWARITAGAGTRKDADLVMAALNICQAIAHVVKYPDEGKHLTKAQESIVELCHRANQLGRLVPKAPEILAINELLAIQDEFLDCITVGQMETAHRFAVSQIKGGKAIKVKGIE